MRGNLARQESWNGSVGVELDRRALARPDSLTRASHFARSPGKGYNVLKGNPLTVGKVDPGFGQSPFSIENNAAYTVTNGDNSCFQASENTVSTSAKQLQGSTASNIGLDAGYGPVAFSGSASWGSTFDSKDESESATIIASTQVRITVARLNDVLNQKLCSTFTSRVRDGLQKLDSPDVKGIMNQILDQYGMSPRVLLRRYAPRYVSLRSRAAHRFFRIPLHQRNELGWQGRAHHQDFGKVSGRRQFKDE